MPAMDDSLHDLLEQVAAVGIASTIAHVLALVAFLVFAIAVMRSRPGFPLVLTAVILRVTSAIVSPVLNYVVTMAASHEGGAEAMFEARIGLSLAGMLVNIAFWVLLMIGLYQMLRAARPEVPRPAQPVGTAGSP